MTKTMWLRVCVGVLLVALIIVCYLMLDPHAVQNDLRVTFLDVGQGDAIFVESPSGTQVLIDGGPGRSVLGELGRELGYFDRTLDLVVATHPDLDHNGGLIDVLERYEVAAILMTENEGNTPAAMAFLNAMAAEGARIITARRGQVFDFGAGAAGSTTLHILFPDREVKNLETNTASIVAQLRYGHTEFLLTGDSPDSIENYLVSLDGAPLKSEVLKAGHHGSKTSSSATFVAAVAPEYAIISAGKDNRYGHPHQDVITTLTEAAVTIKNTAESGNISCVSDGVSVQC